MMIIGCDYLLKDDFPRIWMPSWENRDLRQLLWHWHRMVQARSWAIVASFVGDSDYRRFGVISTDAARF